MNSGSSGLIEQHFSDRLRPVDSSSPAEPRRYRARAAPPERLTLEITERLVIDNVEQTIERMQHLKSLGISLAIDDFGTGHASLAYLKRLPLDALKIDRSFGLDLDSDPNDAVIVETITVMSQHLRLDVVAEGVETDAVLDFLTSGGCEFFQGYLFGRPAPFGQLTGRHRTALAAEATG